MLKLRLTDGTPRFFKCGKEVHPDYTCPDYKCEPPINPNKTEFAAPPRTEPKAQDLFFPTCDIDGSHLNPGKNGLWARVPTDSYISVAYKFYSWDELPRDICEQYGH